MYTVRRRQRIVSYERDGGPSSPNPSDAERYANEPENYFRLQQKLNLPKVIAAACASRPFHPAEASVAERLTCLPSTKAVNRVQSPAVPLPDFRMWELCRMMPLVGGFSRDLPFPHASSFRRCNILNSITPQLAVKSSPNLFTHFTRNSIRLRVQGCSTSLFHPQDFRISKTARTPLTYDGIVRSPARSVYNFEIHGQVHHLTSVSVHPVHDVDARYNQLYFVDVDMAYATRVQQHYIYNVDARELLRADGIMFPRRLVFAFDRWKIVTCRDSGLCYHEIGSHVGRNETTVKWIWDQWVEEGWAERRAIRPRRANESGYRRQNTFVQESRHAAHQSVSSCMVRCRLEGVLSRRPLLRLPLTARHEHLPMQSCVEQHGVVAWGAIGFQSRLRLVSITGTLTRSCWGSVIIPDIQSQLEALYQQNNARPREASDGSWMTTVSHCFLGQYVHWISCLSWSMVRRLACYRTLAAPTNEILASVKAAWAEIPQADIQRSEYSHLLAKICSCRGLFRTRFPSTALARPGYFKTWITLVALQGCPLPSRELVLQSLCLPLFTAPVILPKLEKGRKLAERRTVIVLHTKHIRQCSHMSRRYSLRQTPIVLALLRSILLIPPSTNTASRRYSLRQTPIVLALLRSILLIQPSTNTASRRYSLHQTPIVLALLRSILLIQPSTNTASRRYSLHRTPEGAGTIGPRAQPAKSDRPKLLRVLLMPCSGDEVVRVHLLTWMIAAWIGISTSRLATQG
ncbi:hypothetical protein PR048_019259 [Dryococelus australis]|uniref:Uncharacterized protein n=1 Tax=Dryococelus australis TaxID=614101 RepID=A0ABQ9H310_9NEOP|nr:hypothetical protein PR048_019259 [Dryococelus australis]